MEVNEMTITSWFISQPETEKEQKWVRMLEREGLEVGTEEFYRKYYKEFCSGEYQLRLEHAGVSVDDLEKAKSDGYLGHREYSNWKAMRTGLTDWWYLTKKGFEYIIKVQKLRNLDI